MTKFQNLIMGKLTEFSQLYAAEPEISIILLVSVLARRVKEAPVINYKLITVRRLRAEKIQLICRITRHVK